MKRAILIFGVIAIACTGLCMAFAFFQIRTLESEKNKARTANANAARRNNSEQPKQDLPLTPQEP